MSLSSQPRPIAEISVRRGYLPGNCLSVCICLLIFEKVLLENRYLFGEHIERVPGKIWGGCVCSVSRHILLENKYLLGEHTSLLEKSIKRCSLKRRTDIFENSLGGCFWSVWSRWFGFSPIHLSGVNLYCKSSEARSVWISKLMILLEGLPNNFVTLADSSDREQDTSSRRHWDFRCQLLRVGLKYMRHLWFCHRWKDEMVEADQTWWILWLYSLHEIWLF